MSGRPVLIDHESNQSKKTALTIREMHPASKPELLNEEWIIVENNGPNSIGVRGCSLTVAESEQRRPHSLGTLEPGFIVEPGARVRIITGSAAKKKEGIPPEQVEGLLNYHLFLKESYLSQPGLVVRLTIRQLDLAHGVFAPENESGVG